MCDFPPSVGAHLTSRRPVLVDFAKSQNSGSSQIFLALKREALRFHGFHEVRRIRFRLEGQTRSHCWLWLGHPLSSFLAQINYHCAVRLNPVIRHLLPLLPLLDLRPPCPLCGPQFYAGQAATTNVRPQGQLPCPITNVTRGLPFACAK